jgi:hypothetical protein
METNKITDYELRQFFKNHCHTEEDLIKTINEARSIYYSLLKSDKEFRK